MALTSKGPHYDLPAKLADSQLEEKIPPAPQGMALQGPEEPKGEDEVTRWPHAPQAPQAHLHLGILSLQFGTWQAAFPAGDGHEIWVGLWGFLRRGEALCPFCHNWKQSLSRIYASPSGAYSCRGPPAAPSPHPLLPPLLSSLRGSKGGW